MGKPTICIGENKDADQLRGLYLTPKVQASSSFLWLYRPVCVGPVRKPHSICWFSHEAAQMIVQPNPAGQQPQHIEAHGLFLHHKM